MNKKYEIIINELITALNPTKVLTETLQKHSFNYEHLYVVAIGKASWVMAKAIAVLFKEQITKGFIITKYHHSLGEIENFEIYEAAHPLTDENGVKASWRIYKQLENLGANDAVLFLLSGGGSALFEIPTISLDFNKEINQQLLTSKATIQEINTIRKRLSKVKGGKFAKHLQPALVYNFILSDVIGDDLDMVASGPTINDSTSDEQAYEIIDKYELPAFSIDTTIHDLNNVENYIIGNIDLMVNNIKNQFEKEKYEVLVINDRVNCDLSVLIKQIETLLLTNVDKSTVYILAGEPTLSVKGQGLGGRNQQLVCSLIESLANTSNTTLISLGSDGTDGPTDAAGGYVDSTTYQKCLKLNLDINTYLDNNDCYHLLKKLDQLIITGPTNTNVNDLILLIIER